MIRFIKGIFHPSPDGSVIVETASGMGFSVSIPANSVLYKHVEGDEVKIYTSMIVKEDDVSLYGFADKENLELFELLITVNGVGAKELKDKVGSFESLTDQGTEEVFVPVSDERSEAVAALIALGYTKNEAASAVGKVQAEGLTCEAYIKQALKNLF